MEDLRNIEKFKDANNKKPKIKTFKSFKIKWWYILIIILLFIIFFPSKSGEIIGQWLHKFLSNLLK